MKRLVRSIPVVLALLATSCSQIEEGVVVEKSIGTATSSYSGVGPSFIVAVAGRDANNKAITRSAMLSQKEWLGIKIGDQFSFKGRGLFHPSNQATAEATPEATPPAPPKHQPRRAKKKARKAVPPPQPAPTPKTIPVSSTPIQPAALPSTPSATPTPAPAKKIEKSPAETKAQPTAAPFSEEKYRRVQAQALEDADVRAAKQKIHAATNDAEQKRASEEYQRILFNKMRKLDSSLQQRTEKGEAGKIGPSPQGSPTP